MRRLHGKSRVNVGMVAFDVLSCHGCVFGAGTCEMSVYIGNYSFLLCLIAIRIWLVTARSKRLGGFWGQTTLRIVTKGVYLGI